MFRKIAGDAIYEESDLDIWAESRIGPKVHSTAELTVGRTQFKGLPPVKKGERRIPSRLSVRPRPSAAPWSTPGRHDRRDQMRRSCCKRTNRDRKPLAGGIVHPHQDEAMIKR